MPPSKAKRNKRRFQKHQDVVLGVRVYIQTTLLQRFEDALGKSGAGDRSSVICALLDQYATDRGC